MIAKMNRETFGPRSERSQRLIDQYELQLEELVAARREDKAKPEPDETPSVTVSAHSRRKSTRATFRAPAAPAHRVSDPCRLPVLQQRQAVEDRRGC